MSSNPHVRGNYSQYYGYRLPVSGKMKHDRFEIASDDRLAHIPERLIKGRSVLDVGCNTGHLSHIIARTMQPRVLVGIDLDAELIKKAQWDLLNQASQLKPRPIRITQNGSNLLDGLPELSQSEIDNEHQYFPLCFPLLFGPIPIAPSPVEASQYPQNLFYQTHDILAPLSSLQQQNVFKQNAPYQTIMAMSVTKWIHLYGGDADIIKFFRMAYTLLQPGGIFIVEPQGWPSYAKYFAHSRFNQEDLKLRPWLDQAGGDESLTFWHMLIHEIGFSNGEVLKAANPQGKAFEKRPIWVMYK